VMNNNEMPQQEKQQKELEMYFSPEVALKFAELEQNDKNFRVARIADRVLMKETKDFNNPVYAAELGGGAHPDRYHDFFSKLLTEPRGHIDWVDVSPYMLDLAKRYIGDDKYKGREEVISFIKSDILEYIRGLEDGKLDIAIMKYTIDHIENIEGLFKLLSSKLKPGGKLVSTIGSTSPELKSYSTNARFLYNGEPFPDDEVRVLKDGDNFTVKFFKVSGDPNAGYLEGAETVKYFHSADKFRELADTFGFNIYLGDWKGLIDEKDQDGEKMDQAILILTKK
ncbi:MAG: class I SAM-dependent methyltransferase, partial [Parcubacteria group bacterium]|nr:class I SAM-dependent methyltransferase [Parcubacteria group bacterium]MCR4342453.1 class I SAM-dependent methyltransferase [Patescibacteria group bacterium]